MTGETTPAHEDRIDPQEGTVDAARVETLLEDLQATTAGGADPVTSALGGDPAQASGDTSVETPSDPAAGSDRMAQFESELAALRSENEALKSQYMRIAADFDNFRKRQSRDQDEQRLHITCTTLTEILPVVDNFDRARQQLNPQSEEAQSLHRSYQNLYKQLVDVFKQLGVSPMRVEGEPFDPKLHEAVLREPSEHHPEDVVIEELQRGYHLNGRVLRHALVKVSMGPGPGGEVRSSDSPTSGGGELDG
ncbi:MAG: molecular chaperone GrpE [Cyanobium sp. CACIAM 14]|nr:MAG: molecular chaperone GrpE [Cyanobium sp. CACIAM 14]